MVVFKKYNRMKYNENELDQISIQNWIKYNSIIMT